MVLASYIELPRDWIQTFSWSRVSSLRFNELSAWSSEQVAKEVLHHHSLWTTFLGALGGSCGSSYWGQWSHPCWADNYKTQCDTEVWFLFYWHNIQNVCNLNLWLKLLPPSFHLVPPPLPWRHIPLPGSCFIFNLALLDMFEGTCTFNTQTSHHWSRDTCHWHNI